MEKNIRERIREALFAAQDLSYKEFHGKLMPTVDPELIIGVRTPQLRALAKNLKKEPEITAFLTDLPHQYYEENNLHGFLIEQIGDFTQCIVEVNRFLPFVDNWATCDMMSPKCFKKHRKELLKEIETWLACAHTYTVRFGVGMLMTHYLDEDFDPSYLEMVAAIRSEEYYIRMMVAWYFATALAKQYDSALPYLEENRLGIWEHNKTIQKAVESSRISGEIKQYLRTLKRKEK